MPPRAARVPFEYAILRIVPRVERGERFNAGIVLQSRVARFLGVRVHLDERRLGALDPEQDPDVVRMALEGLERIGVGDPGAGPIARLSAPERFHWLVAPSSTVVQASEVHTGLTDDPAAELDHLFRRLVLPPPG
jgi:hypothetical protein